MNSFFRTTWHLAKPYWQSKEKWLAFTLLAVIIALNLGEVYLNVLLNKWNNDFYNALQTVDKKAFLSALIRFSWLATAFIIVVVYKIYLNQMLQIRWRRWMTGHFLTRWLDNQNHYRMQLESNQTDNPDQRISEDIGQFISLTLDLSLGSLSSIVTLFSFLFILWNLSGSLTIGHVVIPGYMVWVAMLYAMAGTWITFKLGRPLVPLNFQQQKYEADFRYSLVRFRENSEPIALYKGEEREHDNFRARFALVFDNYWQIMKRQKTLTWFTSGYSQIANIFPVLVAAPRYFAKQIQLGALMQTASAFGHVQDAFSYLINAYGSIATWRAVVNRLGGFDSNIDHAIVVDNESEVVRDVNDGTSLIAQDISIQLPNGETLLDNVNLEIGKGDSLLISGPSGCGKSTLLRVLAGIWPFASGKLTLPHNATTLFLPQIPYLPLGTLRDVLCYPFFYETSNDDLLAALKLCHLDALSGRLDETDHWATILSPGERQRIAFARVLITKPDFVFLDEASSALDEALEAELYGVIRHQLPGTALVSVGHRSTLSQWHNKHLNL